MNGMPLRSAPRTAQQSAGVDTATEWTSKYSSLSAVLCCRQDYREIVLVAVAGHTGISKVRHLQRVRSCYLHEQSSLSSTRSLHHLPIGGSGQRLSERERGSPYSLAPLISALLWSHADGRLLLAQLRSLSQCFFSESCAFSRHEDAPAPACPGMDVVIAGGFLDIQWCSWDFANNP